MSTPAAPYRPLNVRDALSYLDQVKIQFYERPEVYNRFLDVMKEFKSQLIDTPGVIERVSNLFRGHPNLIQGFNTFLPPGYHIVCINDASGNVISVTTPSGTTQHIQSDKAEPVKPAETRAPAKAEPKAAAAARPATNSQRSATAAANAESKQKSQYALEFNHAITFVNKIKNRFNADTDTYKQFLEILQTYQREGRDITEVFEQVNKLFGNAPDLINEFKQFLPEAGSTASKFGSVVQAATDSSLAPKKPVQKKRKTEPKKVAPVDQQTLASPEEVAFFDKVKKHIDDKVTYHEFLKLINLFTQDIIDTATLLDRAEHFIGGSAELWTAFRKMILVDEAGNPPPNPQSSQGGYGFGGMINTDAQAIELTPMLDRVKPDLGGPNVKTYGPSYRKLPKSEINLPCSGRDALCWEVLNDEWVSHPTWAAEDAAPFMSHKKNIYEEALHKSEEERHEYDYHIEANLRTIALLEPINNKMQTMDPEERSRFTLKSGLGGLSRSIYHRVIKKVYGKDLGYEIVKALMENPVVAVPIVLERLKAKDDEWKKAQREWNRVWREQDAKNFYKALDHQGIQFKQTDKKTISLKALVTEAENRRREQLKTRSQLLDSAAWRPTPQFEFDFSDVQVLQDVVKLAISLLDRSNGIQPKDRERVETQLRDFIPLLWMLDKEEFDDFGAAERDSDDDEESEDEKKVEPADLRKRLLKSVGRDRGTSTPVPDDESDMARGETPLPIPDDPQAVAAAVEQDKEQADASEQTWVDVSVEAEDRRLQRKGLFFANTNIYVLIRLVHILYSRLLNCKTEAAQLAAEKKRPINPIAINLGLAEPETNNFAIEAGDNPAEHYYGHLLVLAERLFDADIDAATFEESLRVMFGTKAYVMFTIDRVLGAILKQMQIIVGDIKSQELIALLERDRRKDKPTLRQQIAYRYSAEMVVGDDEYLYKIETVPARNAMSVSLLGREEPTVTDLETTEREWRYYVDSYVLTHKTEGLSHRVDEPLLKRNLGELEGAHLERSDGLACRIAFGTYKMFAVEDSEDYFHHRRAASPEADKEAQKKRLDEVTARLMARVV